jgi:hypothetical protein
MAVSRPKTRVEGRQTVPASFTPYDRGGLGIVGGGWHESGCDLTRENGVSRLAWSNPGRLLKELVRSHSTLDLALDTLVNLACAPDDVQIRAVVDGPNGEEVDEEGTQALSSLWNALPSEYAGFGGLQAMLTVEMALTGYALVECVPGRRGQGVQSVNPVDSLSLDFARNGDGLTYPRQRQTGQWVDLSSETCFWASLSRTADNPKGRAWFGTAANEALADLAMYRDIRAAIHLAGNPRYTQAFPLTRLMAYATAPEPPAPDDSSYEPNATYGLGLSLEEAQAWADEQFAKLRATAGELLADDVWFTVEGGEIKILDGAKGMSQLADMARLLDLRLARAAKTPPLLLSMSEGTTETQAIRQLEVYASRLETLRATVTQILWAAAALHLRLLGRNSRPKAIFRPIRGTDALTLAQTEAAQGANVEANIRRGFTSIEDGSREVTGSLPADPKRAEAYFSQDVIRQTAPPPARSVVYPKGNLSRAAA